MMRSMAAIDIDGAIKEIILAISQGGYSTVELYLKQACNYVHRPVTISKFRRARQRNDDTKSISVPH